MNEDFFLWKHFNFLTITQFTKVYSSTLRALLSTQSDVLTQNRKKEKACSKELIKHKTMVIQKIV